MTEAKSGLQPEAGSGGRPSAGRRWLVFAPLGIFVLLAVAFAVLIFTGRNTEDLPSALINQPAPEFDMEPLEGLAFADGTPVPGFSTQSLIGQVTVVNVWASWCPPCRVEHPFMLQLGADERFAVYGIDLADPPTAAVAFLEDEGLPYDAVGVDPRRRVSIDWGVTGPPETFLVDQQGVVRYKHIGPLDDTVIQDELMPLIEALLAEGAGGN